MGHCIGRSHLDLLSIEQDYSDKVDLYFNNEMLLILRYIKIENKAKRDFRMAREMNECMIKSISGSKDLNFLPD
jgi:hypothetical protein